MSFLDELERDLLDAAERRRRARRAAAGVRARRRFGLHALRRVALATALFALIGAATAGAGLLLLRGSVIPGPATRDVPPDQLPLPGTARATGLTADDPEPGRPPWTLRLARSSTGLLCSTVGQLDDGRFGLVGLDGRFRAYSERIVDSCGEQLSGERASLVGARVFDADDPQEVRTVVNGVAGPALRAVSLEARGRARELPIGPGGTFLAALAGYPEDSGVEVELRFASGHVERHAFGRSDRVVLDPDGGQAWKTWALGIGNDRRTCVSFSLARISDENIISPRACGVLRREGRERRGHFFAVRRLVPGTPAEPPGQGWRDHPPRTAVWGAVGDEVDAVEVSGPGGLEARPAIGDSRAFLAVFGGDVDPASLAVTLRYDDGRVVRSRGSVNLVDRRMPLR
ncbi:hypothetical protein [Conexibacter arvalis]|uniref:Uncharacterized protein n=1 Tax=Conexibacter arvalis TaxID=912552 RepID=A0A840IBA6_9ACTN|nr:hypothetical protein [Conexibacter arvalis]MBB4661912.1 hypothetical protein [Conexibacter arvalis]